MNTGGQSDNGYTRNEDQNKRIHILYENNLKDNIERERNITMKKVNDMQ